MKTMQDLFYQEKQAWLMSARVAAIKLLKKRKTITIEDVLKLVERPSHIHPNTTGSVFTTRDFKPCGWTPSKRPVMNGRQVRVWRLAK